MRIGIITLWGTNNNYGNMLQAYALQQYLKDCGHDVFHIVYKPGRKNMKEQLLAFLPNPVKRIVHLLKRLSNRKEKLLANEFGKNTPRYFNEFIKQHITTYENVYEGVQSIKKDPPIADVYITGSDQVWHSYDWMDEYAPYYLDFGDKEVKRIAYAVSFGRNNISERKKHKMRDLLITFNGISVREQPSVNLCKEIGFSNTVQLIDPTMLLSEDKYDKLLEGQNINKWIAKKKIFCYFLNFQTGDDIHWNEILEILNDKNTSLRLVISSGSTLAYDRLGFDNYYSPDIYNWIYSVKTSDYVITNSFHGLVFSLLFHKKFSVVLLNGEIMVMNNRVLSLLKEIGLENRILTDKRNIHNVLEEKIDWSLTDAYLTKKRNETALFFSQSGI